MPNPKLETYKNKATGNVYDYTDADAQGKLTAILDGTSIDSFSDVESALDDKADESTVEAILNGTSLDSFGDVETALADKVDKVAGKGLSTNDYDDTEKAKVAAAFPRSEQAVLGAVNLFDKTKGTPNNATVTQTSNGFRAQVSNKDYAYVAFVMDNPKKNTDVTFSDYANITTAGNYIRLTAAGSNDKSSWTTIKYTENITTSQNRELSFNTGNYDYIRIVYNLTSSTADSADVTFENPMLNLGSVALPYVDFAMTNRELTEKMVKHAVIDIALESTISKNQWEEVQALNSYDLRDKIPDIKEAVSVEYMWSNGSRCVPVNQYLSGRHYTLNLLALAAVSVSTVRLNVAYI